MTNARNLLPALAVAVAAALMPVEAAAYTGPGAGISAIGSVLALFAALFLAIVGFVWYPVKRLVKSFRKAPVAAAAGQASDQSVQ